MKSKVLAIAALLIATSAGNAFSAITWLTANADKTFTVGNTANGPQLVLKPSANVTIAYMSTSGVSYSVGTYHSSGTKSYGSSSMDTRIYMYENAAQSSAQLPPDDLNSNLSAPTWGAGWTAMK